MPSFSTSVPGKTILFGEHAVVYGYPAIAVPLETISLNIKISARPNAEKSLIINKVLGESLILEDLEPDHTYRTAIDSILKALQLKRLPPLQIGISSTIPISSGLGSSAAFAVCLTRAITGFLGFKFSDEKINAIAYSIEVFQHGTPSGIDNTVIAFNKPVFFKKNSPPCFLKINKTLTLVIADTGIRSITKATIAKVKEMKDSNPSLINKLLDGIGQIVLDASYSLNEGNIKALGMKMTANHALLQKLGVSCHELDHLVEVALDSGALGAKLCGSGKGGNIVALVDAHNAETIKSALMDNGSLNCFISKIKKDLEEK